MIFGGINFIEQLPFVNKNTGSAQLMCFYVAQN